MKRVLLTGLLIAVTAVWGWTFVVVKDAIALYGVLGFLAIRFAIASGCLGVLCARRMTWRTFAVGAGIGVAMAAGYLLQTFGLQYTTPTHSGLVTGLFVVCAPTAAWVFFRVRPGWVLVACVAVSLVGMVLLTGQSPERLREGDLLTLGCAAAYGLHIALLSRYSKGHDAMALALAQMLAATALFGLAWPVFEPVSWPPPKVWFSLILTGTLASALAFYVQTLVQQRLSAARTAVVLTMEPVFAAFFGYWLAGDRLTPVQILGAACIVAALAWETVSGLLARQLTNGRR
jgi:drug/metabolite transporter (DMT)-like permease